MLDLGKKSIYLSLLAFVQILGIALFCKGFFPYKVYLSGHATSNDLPSSVIELHNQQEPEFDRLVFVLIDALRNDFLFGPNSEFEFVKSQIQQGSAYPFTAKATAPTVTLPRVKALTTGTIPSFLDAILNIAESDTSSSLNKHDNWVYQFKNNGNKTMHFFGDDTWIRLFPGLFDKTDGTTSFFVSDTTEVDHNVTRHIKTDLRENDWDAVILHYLGLDHIGHLGGPDSPLMKPKQKEMDQAIESIYNIVADQDAKRIIDDPRAKGTLIVVCGDHGMNEKGNHGGSSIGETSAALAFLSPRFESRPSKYQKPLLDINRPAVLGYPVIDQIDIVPTLAALFAFPIPKNNLGKIIFEIFKSQSDTVLRGLLLNASQLGMLLSRTIPGIAKYINEPLSYLNCNEDTELPGCYYAQAIALHQKYLAADSQQKEQLGRNAGELYCKFIKIAQSHLANTASDYSLNLMIIGVLFISISAIGFVYWSTYQTCNLYWNFSKYFSVIAVGIYSASMFASSFVEEEHITWYGFLQTMTVLSILHSFRLPDQSIQEQMYLVRLCFAQLVLVRIAIAWNHGGLSEQVLSYSGVQWHLMVLTLLTAVITGIKAMLRLVQMQSIDVNHTAKIIQTMIRAALALITILNSVLVLAYKMRAYSSAASSVDHIPTMYAGLLDWELVKSLDQVQLGRLVYNYGGAGLFVLLGLVYVTKRAALMDLSLGTYNEENKTGVILQILLYSITPILVLLSGTHNAFLFFIFNLQFQLLLRWQQHLGNRSPVPVWLISMIIACLSHASFFLTGHTNSIASVDLSNAYVGVQEYDTTLIGLLTFCSNWSGSIWWAVAGWVLIADHRLWSHPENHTYSDWLDHLVVQSTLFSLVLALLSISVTVLREHLFIWTVFSPKYLYQIAWICLYHWLLQVVIGSLFTQIVFNGKLAPTLEEDKTDYDNVVDFQYDDGDDDDELEQSNLEDEVDLETEEVDECNI